MVVGVSLFARRSAKESFCLPIAIVQFDSSSNRHIALANHASARGWTIANNKERAVEAIAIVTALALIQLSAFGFLVGKARGKYGVSAPAITGNAHFEREFRVHQNTLEQLVAVIPAMWMFGMYVHALTAAALGLVFVVSRFIYRNAYLKDPKSRSPGFGIGAVCTMTLLLGSVVGAALAWYQG
jgi:glutathione S-transferase